MRFFFTVIIILVSITVFCQKPVLKNYSNKNGLPSNEVFHIMQDSKGYIWFSTNSGVSRFDGYKFHNLDMRHGMPDITVFNTFEDFKKRIWIIPLSNKLSYFENDTVINYKYNDSLIKTLSGAAMIAKNSLKIKPDGSIHLSALNRGVIDIDKWGKTKIKYSSMNENSHLLINENNKLEFVAVPTKQKNLTYIKDGKEFLVDSMELSSKGGIYFSLFKPNGNVIFTAANMILEIDRNNKMKIHRLPNVIIWIHIEKNGDLWIGLNKGGVYLYKNADLTQKPVLSMLNDLSVSSVMIDKENGIWFSTLEEGVFYTSGLDFLSYTTQDGLSANRVLSLGVDNNKRLLAGFNKPFINQLYNGKFKCIEINSFKNTNINIILNHKGRVYSGANMGVDIIDEKILNGADTFYSIAKNKTAEYSVISLAHSGKEYLWAGSAYTLGKIRDNKILFSSHDVNVRLRCLSLEPDGDESVWIGTPNGLVFYDNSAFTDYYKINPDLNKRINKIKHLNSEMLVLGTKGNGLLLWNKKNNELHSISTNHGITGSNISALYIEKNTIWAGTETGLNKIVISSVKPLKYNIEKFTSENGLPANEVNDIIVIDSLIFLATNSGITKFNYNTIKGSVNNIPVFITGFRVNQIKQKLLNKYELSHDQNFIDIDFVGLGFKNAGKLTYKYITEGLNSEELTTKNNQMQFPSLPPGEYTFKVWVINENGSEKSECATVKFTINPPFWKTFWFYSLMLLLAAMLVFIYIKWREKKLLVEKKILEEKVNERTAEVVMQKGEIQQQKEEIEAQRDELSIQKHIVEEKNKDITDSINYAKRLQDAILPSKEVLEIFDKRIFVLFQPKDIVSGDIYWVDSRHNNIYFAVIDCTGHGVPGAFMSIVGHNALTRVMVGWNKIHPAEILDTMSHLIEETFKNADTNIKDGMDMALCSWNKETQTLEYAGANNPIYIVRPNEEKLMVNNQEQMPAETFENLNIYEITADKQPVGAYAYKMPFTNKTIRIKENDTVYLFSDGYADQFGGADGKKFKYKRFRKTLLNLEELEISSRPSALKYIFSQWCGNFEQVDDICILGVKL